MSTHGTIKKAAIQALQKVVGQAFIEGATRLQIKEHLIAEGVTDPEPIIARVEGMKIIPVMGGAQLLQYGGRNKFRAIFNLPPATEPMPKDEPEDFPQTESGDAEHFVEMFQERVRYDHRKGRWLISHDETGLWLPDKTEEIYELAKHAQRERQKRALMIENQEKRKAVLEWALKGENRNRLTNLLALANTIPPIADDGEHWDEDPFLLGCGNGVIDLRTSELRKAKPEEHITMRVRADYDPSAPSPLWDRTLRAIFAVPVMESSDRASDTLLETQPQKPSETDEMIAFMRRALGYSITGDCREECCFFAWGEGSNGKGTMMNTIGWLMADYYDDMPYTTLEKNVYGSGISSDVAKIAGKRFITSSEVNEFHINESRLKAMTGRDPMTARFLYQNEFTFIPVGKIWVATNNKPKIMGQDEGIWRRIYLIPFVNHFEGANKNTLLKDQLRDELPGILRWLVQGAKEWYEQGLMPPAAVRAATDEYRAESDPLTPFFEQRCVIEPNATAPSVALWNEYISFCTNAGVDELWRLGQKRFHASLKKRFSTRETRGESRQRVTHFVGIGLREQSRRTEVPY